MRVCLGGRSRLRYRTGPEARTGEAKARNLEGGCEAPNDAL